MNCKPGDLAIIIKAPLSLDGSPIGMVVEVLKDWADHLKYGHCWLCRFSDLMETSRGGTSYVAHVPDDWLRPISGVPVKDDVEDEVLA
ncbi:hypothetical protein [Burkholderia gladioli]|uniref:hypothetical protein n=1 Tax=Burkholderia gladioli TaxID=28095 RepID=UPI0016408E81|nr:hypothetical protein [Burkholderia gladioli]